MRQYIAESQWAWPQRAGLAAGLPSELKAVPGAAPRPSRRLRAPIEPLCPFWVARRPAATRSFSPLGSGGPAGGKADLKLTRKSLISIERRNGPKRLTG